MDDGRRRPYTFPMRTLGLSFGLLLAGSTLALPAAAIAPATGASSPRFELLDGSDGRRSVRVSPQPQRRRTAAAMRILEADLGGRQLLGLFDGTTDLPRRAWGFSVPVAGASANGAIAQKAAQELLARHVALLSPGASVSDFAPMVDHFEPDAGGLRTVGFAQLHQGLPVLGGHVSFRFKNDRLFGLASEAFPDVRVVVPKRLVAPAAVVAAARAWVLAGSAQAEVAGPVEGPFILPVATPSGFSYRVVLRVRVAAEQPVGLYDVYVDAATGVAVAREQQLFFESARIDIESWERAPSYGPRVQLPADRVTVDLDATQATGQTTSEGAFSFEGPTAMGTASLLGDQVKVRNMDGADLTLSLDVTAGDEVLWSSPSEVADAQLNAFVHSGQINDYARTFAPDLAFLDEQVDVQVNIEDVCNAYSNLSRIHFYKAGGGCENTARIADVVYHEYGHSIHGHAYLFCPVVGGSACIPPDGSALSEGISDFFAATFTGDPKMARGFFQDQQPLRDLEPEEGEAVWPNDAVGEPHYDGLIIGGALWDLRQLLVDELGEEEGVRVTNRLAYQGIERAGNIPEMYPEMLFADDDDGDLGNGTPHGCAIDQAMGRHGLRPLAGNVTAPGLAPPSQDGYAVSLAVPGLSAACGETLSNAYMTWADTDDATRSGLVEMEIGDDGVARGNLPPQQDGHLIRFDVRVQNAGVELHFPQNAADPVYQLYVGDVTPLYCTNFETDPFGEGWSHELLSGVAQEGADDWMWGSPNGTAENGDPADAWSGNFAVGQDMTPKPNWNGRYQPDHRTALVSPVIPTSAFDQVRLQYRRWLNVEDGYFDQASILADGTPVWSNYQSPGGGEASVHHADREWRFHDVDITSQASDGSVQLRWELESDGGLEFGGWTLDDVCVVGFNRTTDGTCASPPCGPSGANAAGAGGGSGSGDGGGDGADPGIDATDDGCGCVVAGASRPTSRLGLAVGVLGLAAALRRRRRR